MNRTVPDVESALRKSYAVIQELRQQLADAAPRRETDIAVIGMACRFPGGADSPEAFWQVLSEGRDTLSEIPAERWDWRRYHHDDAGVAGTHYARHGSFIDRVGQFDPDFFGISQREADSLDPQHRLLLEVSWEAIERAGVAPAQLRNSRTGVFVGIGQNDYAQRQMYSGSPASINAYDGTGISFCFAAARISYLLGLQGPNMALDTACSSSLVALHLACQSLSNGECEQALAGGSHLVLSPEVTIYLSRLRALSADGRSKAFSADADGYGRGEGCGMLLLKRLSDARRDGDPILAVVRGSAINHDGPSSGMTVPNGLAQQALLTEALKRANLKPSEIDAIEAHGTGTAMGDPIELAALGEVFGKEGRAGRALHLGSVKTNIGHLEAASGIAGVIKTILAFEHGALPPHLHLNTPNAQIAWERHPFVIPTAITPWGGPRLAGVSAFGLGGTNAHVILSSAAASAPPVAPLPGHWPLLLSARTAPALEALRARYLDLLAGTSAGLADIAAGAALGRSHFGYRLAVCASSVAEAATQLRSATLPADAVLAAPRVVFLFSGQGSQYCGMGRALYRDNAVFRHALEHCAALVEHATGWSPLMFVAGPELDSRIDQTEYTQPTLFAIQYALVMLWRAWGVTPQLVIGHSIGEFAAAWSAGVFSLDDAVRLVVQRARLMQTLPAGGAMAALRVSREQAQAALGKSGSNAGAYPGLCVAAINSPRALTIAGPEAQLQACLDALQAQGIAGQRLPVSHAFHSPLMAPMLDAFSATLAEVRMAAPAIAMALTGAPGRVDSAAYWRQQIISPVDFAAAASALGADDFVIEIGPSGSLLGLARQCVDLPVTACAASLERDKPGATGAALARLYCAGGEPDWRQVMPARPQPVLLPTYPFQRRHCWITAPAHSAPAPDASAHPLLGRLIDSPQAQRQYAARVSPLLPAWLGDHRVRGEVLFPAAGFVEMALSAAAAHFGTDRLSLCDIAFQRTLAVTPSTHLHLVLTPQEADCSITIHARAAEAQPWSLHASCTARPLHSPPAPARQPDTAALSHISGAQFYQDSAERGIVYGPAFQSLTRLDTYPGEHGVSSYQLARGLDDARLLLHPVLFDSALQALCAARPDIGRQTFIPVHIAQLDFVPGSAHAGSVLSRIAGAAGPDAELGEVQLLDWNGACCVSARGIRMQRVASEQALPAPVWQARWEALSARPAAAPRGHWLLVGDEGTLGALLQGAGANVTSVSAARLRDRFEAAWPRADGPFGPVSAICYLALASDTANPCLSELALVQRLAALAPAEQPRLLFVTRGAQQVEASGEQPDPFDAALWGLARVVRNEFAGLGCTNVDLDPLASAEDEARALLHEWGSSDEDQAAWRNGVRYALRLAPASLLAPAARSLPARLACQAIGELDSLAFVAADCAAPGPGEVQVRVRAASLNFKDVLHALGVLSMAADGSAPQFGFDAAGIIEAVGPGCGALEPGDRVMLSLTPGTMGDLVNARAQFVCRMPARFSFAQAAALPLAYLTAWHALVNVANLRCGQRILIHAGAGGVGQAALAIARHLGAEVYATASAPKQRRLRTQGVAAVFTSRSSAFREQLRDVAPDGVDVVLNCLTGDLIGAGFDCLRSGGHFVEIGKSGVWSAAQAHAYRPDADYTVFDLADVARADPGRIGAMFAQLLAAFESAALPPLPLHAFSSANVADAFRLVTRSRHVGKVVVMFPPPQEREGVHVISGGAGALAGLLWRDLAARGVRHIALLVRRPLDAIEAAPGVIVRAYQDDLSDPEALRLTLTRISADFGVPVTAIYHTAGALGDGALANQDAASFAKVAQPKLHGAFNLHLACSGLDLDRFVLFSSAAALIGTPGQSSYAAANAGLDALACARQGAGLPGLSVAWGPWDGGGMAARLGRAERERMAGAGVTPLQPAPAWAAMHGLLAHGTAAAMVMQADWSRVRAQLPAMRGGSLLRAMRSEAVAAPQLADAALAATIGALAPAERRSALTRELQRRVAAILGRPNPRDIAPGQGLFALGMDSLTSMELRNRLQQDLSCKLPATLAFDYPSIDALADYLLASTPAWHQAAPAQDGAAASAAAELDAMTEDEVAQMLARELQDL